MTRRVAIIGQGYVGLPLAVRAAQAGHHVVGYDIDVNRIKRLIAGESYVEDVPSATLVELLVAGSYQPSADDQDLARFDVAIIAVPTPLRDGVPDLSYIESAAAALATYLRPGTMVILESTTYPGTTEELLRPLLENGSGLVAGVDFHLGYSPERIDPGNRQWHLGNTPKVVAGVNAASTDEMVAFYRTLTERTVPVSAPKVAELAKLVENTFRHVNIALMNEIAMYAHELDIDVWEAIDAASSKPFGFMRFNPGPGVGGHCLPVDPEYLSWRVHRSLGRRFRFIELAAHINNQMPSYVVQRLLHAFNARGRTLNGARILLLGLAYKPNTSDARESPALRVVKHLLHFDARVFAVDPHVVESASLDDRVKRVAFGREELDAADAVVILTDHDDFDYEMVARHSQYVLDCRRRLRPGPNVDLL